MRPRLEQPHDEGAGAGERVEDVHALVGEAAAELVAQHVVDARGG